MSINIYAFYNNKGGVGKTTLCSNAATLYANNNPKTQVKQIYLSFYLVVVKKGMK
jgi:cellulose biosynthesis protein BcsQ